MNQIRKALALAGRRLGVNDFLHGVHVAAVCLAGVALLLVLAAKSSPAVTIPWTWLLPVMAVAALAAGFVWMRWRRREAPELALAVDRRLGLDERLSTALYCEGRDDGFARAAVEDAVEVASDASMPARVRRGFPVTAPRGWWASPLVALAAMAALFLPQGDLFREDKPAEDILQARQEAEVSVKSLAEQVRQDPLLEKELMDVLEQLEDLKLDGETLRTAEDLRREAIRKATQLNERLEELLSGEKGMQEQALRDALKNMAPMEEGPAKEIADALSKGDFRAASEAMEALRQQIESGDMTPEQKEQAAEQLAEIAKQLEQLAQEQKALEDALRKAGMDPQLARNPEALKQALSQNQNLNEQQKQQLQQMANAQQAANQMCKSLAQGAMGMAQAMQAGQSGQPGQAGQSMTLSQAAQQMGEALSDAEALQQMLQQARAAASACQGQCQGMGEGLSMSDLWAKLGQGQGRSGQGGGAGAFGGRGQGAGGNAPVSKTPSGHKVERENVQNTGGDIIARQLVRGEQIVGEAKRQLEQVAAQEARPGDEMVSEERVPPHLKEVHKHYFGRLKKRIEDATGGTPASGGAGGAAGAGAGGAEAPKSS